MAGVEVWFIRHGETDWNRDDRILAATEVPLNDVGRSQARRLGARLARDGVRFDDVFTSDLGRARETAALAFPSRAVRVEPRVRELDYGVFEGHRWSDLTGDLARQATEWRTDPYRRRAPGGESYDDVIGRVDAFRRAIPDGTRVAVVSHGGTIRCALYAAMRRPPRGVWSLEIANTGVTRIRYTDDAVTLVTLNDHAHVGIDSR